MDIDFLMFICYYLPSKYFFNNFIRDCDENIKVIFCDNIKNMGKIQEQESWKTGKEKIEKEKVLEMLKTKGVEDPETKALVLEWTKEREAVVAKENTSRAAIVFNIERSDLYVAANDIEGAIECLESALTQAEQENEEKLRKEILEKIESLEESNK